MCVCVYISTYVCEHKHNASIILIFNTDNHLVTYITALNLCMI